MFSNVGINFIQNDDCVILHQNDYGKNRDILKLSHGRRSGKKYFDLSGGTV